MTKEQQFLVQKAQDSLRAAKLLATEGMADFAVSRAYYAMFYIAEVLRDRMTETYRDRLIA